MKAISRIGAILFVASAAAGYGQTQTGGSNAITSEQIEEVHANREVTTKMRDLAIELDNRPGALAEIGETLGRAGVSIEGGGAWVVNGHGVAHFLFEDGAAARQALEAAGIRVLAIREVLVQKLNQDEPGQLGKISRRMADAGVNIEVLYSDHNHQLILVVDDMVKGRKVSEAWTHERRPTP